MCEGVLAHNAMLDMLPTSRCPASLLYNIVRGGVLAHDAMLDILPTSRCPASLLCSSSMNPSFTSTFCSGWVLLSLAGQ